MESFEISLRYLIATVLFSLILGENTYSFRDAGNWYKQYPKCKGKFQSPVAMMDETDVDHIAAPINERLKFKDSHKVPTKMIIKNTGHAVEIKADWIGKRPSVTGGPLNGNYVFEKTMFRWAQQKWTEWIHYSPSDFDNISQDVEMQFYFYKAAWKSFEKAESQKDGLAVFKAGLYNIPTRQDPFFKDLEKVIHKVQSVNKTAQIRPFPLLSFVDVTDAPPFLFHKGSLDYPPCSESVTWFQAQSEVHTSKNMINGFRKIKLDEGDVSNVRPLQPLNNRPVMEVFAEYHEGHDG